MIQNWNKNGKPNNRELTEEWNKLPAAVKEKYQWNFQNWKDEKLLTTKG